MEYHVIRHAILIIEYPLECGDGIVPLIIEVKPVKNISISPVAWISNTLPRRCEANNVQFMTKTCCEPNCS
jgi:hypothetical protein